MKKDAGFAAALVLSVGASGCADLTHFNRSIQAPDGHTTQFVDAKQRIISTSKRLDPETRDPRTGIPVEVFEVCAEPSPDALSALAASQGFSLGTSEIETALSNSLSEGASSIGLRTQSIQLMRDSMYRLCEAHMSGFIGDLAFETLHRRFQSSMVAILAIEQLTSVSRPPAVMIGGMGGSASAELVAETTRLAEKAKADRDAQQKRIETLEKEMEPLKTSVVEREGELDKAKADQATRDSDKELADRKAKLAGKKKDLDAAKQELDDLDRAYKFVDEERRAALAGTRTEVRLDIERVQGPRREAEVAQLSKAVSEIVQSTLQLSFSDELCATVLIAAADGQLHLENGATSAPQTVSVASDPAKERLNALDAEIATVLADSNAAYKQLGEADVALRNAQSKAGFDPEAETTKRLKASYEDALGKLAVTGNRLETLNSEKRKLQRPSTTQKEISDSVVARCSSILEREATLLDQRVEWERAKAKLITAALGATPKVSDVVALLNAMTELEKVSKARDPGVSTPLDGSGSGLRTVSNSTR